VCGGSNEGLPTDLPTSEEREEIKKYEKRLLAHFAAYHYGARRFANLIA
jgi:hypothetical protein